MTVSVQRKPWSSEETERLIRSWDEIGSITVISVLLDRTSSSVQTQASRIGLPRRGEQLQRHRRRWLRSEERSLEDSLSKNTDVLGQVDIYEVASELNRSVDAIAAKIENRFENEAQMQKSLIIPERVKQSFFGTKAAKKDKTEYMERGAIQDTRFKERMRKCMTCTNPFWSEGAHNRICDKCKRAHDSDDLGAE